MSAATEGGEHPVLERRPGFAGRVISVHSDTVAMPSGPPAVRDVVVHPGAVGVVAVDEEDHVVLVRQYRHPVGRRLWELPAGLLDEPEESALETAVRELAEEAGLAAGRWSILLDGLTSPGMTDEAIRIYLAEQLRAVPRGPGRDEEADLVLERVPLDVAVTRVMSGEIGNLTACAGLLALQACRSGAGPARPASSPWPDRPGR